MSRTCILIGLLILLPGLVGATTLIVPSSEYPTIQAGVDSAQVGDTVLVADGTYTGDGNRDIEFLGRDIVLRSQNGPETTIIDCEGTAEEDHRAFRSSRGETPACRVEGFTIASGYWAYAGGAIYLHTASLSISDCVFRDNYSNMGGAIYAFRSTLEIAGCQFFGNESVNGGAVNVQTSTASIDRCRFENNLAQLGGAVYSRSYSSTSLTDCELLHNTATMYGGAVYCGPTDNQTELVQCNLLENRSDSVGAVLFSESGDGTAELSNCLIAYNRNNLAFGGDTAILACCNVFANDWGDYAESITGQEGMRGNISANPWFCSKPTDDFTLMEGSPCLPENNSCGELIGLYGVGCFPGEGSTWRLDADGTADAATIQEAVDLALFGDTILLAPGVFRGPGNRDVDFGGKSLTLTSELGPEHTTIDCEGSALEPHRALKLQSGEDTSTVISGITFMNGWALDDDTTHGGNCGGAILIWSSSATIVDCRFIDNRAPGRGAGIRARNNSHTVIRDCYFAGGTGDCGGGVDISWYSTSHIVNCVFEDNHVTGWGGGIHSDFHSSVEIDSCDVRENTIQNGGGAIAIKLGVYARLSDCSIADNVAYLNHPNAGGVLCYSDSLLIERCFVLRNVSEYAGGIRIGGKHIIIRDCVVAKNTAKVLGGGLYVRNSPALIENCTIVENYAGMDNGGGNICARDSESNPIIIRNCIVSFAHGGNAIGDVNYDGPWGTTENCDIYANLYENWPLEYDEQMRTAGNFQEHPLFCDRYGDDYHLAAGSPCLPENNPSGRLIGALGLGCDMEPDTWYVKADGSGDAPTIQAAIDSATHGDTVLIADGTYTGEGNFDLSYRGKLLVLTSQNGPEKTIIDCQASEASPKRGFLFDQGEDSRAILQNLTITGGFTAHGAGVFCDWYCTPQVLNCVITENFAQGAGGGVLVQRSTPYFENCVLSGNRANVGGGFYLNVYANITIQNCTIVSNVASFFDRGHADAIYSHLSAPRIDRSIIAAGSPYNEAIYCEFASAPEVTCTNIVGFGQGDWVSCIDSLEGVHGNMSVDPIFCDTLEGNYRLRPESLCAPSNSDCGVLIGARGVGCDPTGVDEPDSTNATSLPTEFALAQNYPNPFNPVTTIGYALPKRSHVEITVHNILGQRVTTLISDERPAGEYSTVWHGTDSRGRPVSTGIYFCRIKAGDFVETKKMLLLK